MRTIKIGDRFKLLRETWEVVELVDKLRFVAKSKIGSITIWNDNHWEDCDWIDPPVTLTKEQAEKIKEIIDEVWGVPEEGDFKRLENEQIKSAIDSLVTKD